MNVPSAYDAGGYTKLIDDNGVPPTPRRLIPKLTEDKKIE